QRQGAGVLGSPESAQAIGNAVHACDELRIQMPQQRQAECRRGFWIRVAWTWSEQVALKNSLAHDDSLSSQWDVPTRAQLIPHSAAKRNISSALQKFSHRPRPPRTRWPQDIPAVPRPIRGWLRADTAPDPRGPVCR